MRRYLVFAGYTYYPEGGAWDIVGARDSLDEARALSREQAGPSYRWSNILDTETGQVEVYGVDFS